jgi:hypothetical protein
VYCLKFLLTLVAGGTYFKVPIVTWGEILQNTSKGYFKVLSREYFKVLSKNTIKY